MPLSCSLKCSAGMNQRSMRSSMVLRRGRNSLKSSHDCEDVERHTTISVPDRAWRDGLDSEACGAKYV